MSELKIKYIVEFCKRAGRIPTERELAVFMLYDRIDNIEIKNQKVV